MGVFATENTENTEEEWDGGRVLLTARACGTRRLGQQTDVWRIPTPNSSVFSVFSVATKDLKQALTFRNGT
jgi:hypothetical protein